MTFFEQAVTEVKQYFTELEGREEPLFSCVERRFNVANTFALYLVPLGDRVSLYLVRHEDEVSVLDRLVNREEYLRYNLLSVFAEVIHQLRWPEASPALLKSLPK